MNRLMIFHHYDVDDLVDDHIVYQLQAYRDFGIKILFVSNSSLPLRETAKIAHLVDTCLLRRNEGFDFGAWKELILDKGPRFFSSFDELILTNCTCYGPVFPLCEMFDKMDSQTCDYWMLTNHSTALGFPAHGQSYFIVLKKTILSSTTFWSFWKYLPPLSLIDDAIWLGEIRFARTLATAGFEGAAYYDASRDVPDYELGHVEPYCMNSADILMTKGRVPLIKIKAVAEWFSRSYSIAPMIFNALSQAKSDYPQKLIINHLRRTQSVSCQRFLPESIAICPEGVQSDVQKARIAYLVAFEGLNTASFDLGEITYSGDLLVLVQNETMVLELEKLIRKEYPCFGYTEICVRPQPSDNGFPLLSTFYERLDRYEHVVLLRNFEKKLRSDALVARVNLMKTRLSLTLNSMVSSSVALLEEEQGLGLVISSLPSVYVLSNDFSKSLDVNVVNFLRTHGIVFQKESHVPVLVSPACPCIVRASILKRLANSVTGKKSEIGVTEDQVLDMLPYIAQAFGYYSKESITQSDLLMNVHLYQDFICSVQFNNKIIHYNRLFFQEMCSRLVKVLQGYLFCRFPGISRARTRFRCARKGIPFSGV